jgi:uncharacterized protein (DUF305 family)
VSRRRVVVYAYRSGGDAVVAAVELPPIGLSARLKDGAALPSDAGVVEFASDTSHIKGVCDVMMTSDRRSERLMKSVIAAVLILFVSASAPAGMVMNDFDEALAHAMDHMDADMKAAPMGGTPDHDFLAMMIPHHQGAIDMAERELQYGHDTRVKRLAQEIIITQQSEIQLMQVYLANARLQRKKN